MKNDRKPIFKMAGLMLATLVVGIVLGGVLTGAVIRHRVENLRDFRTAEGFARHMSEIIGPVPEARRGDVQAILLATGRTVENALDGRRTELMLALDDMEAQLSVVLTPEQLARWQALRQRMRNRVGGP
ncbi:MAG: hypothetical protein EP335_08490 [Alphaproteobacteria bacterium]|nr:MAG: hypothetical protein EP335_08490 [Alphaproteobacteria bacterium]